MKRLMMISPPSKSWADPCAPSSSFETRHWYIPASCLWTRLISRTVPPLLLLLLLIWWSSSAAKVICCPSLYHWMVLTGWPDVMQVKTADPFKSTVSSDGSIWARRGSDYQNEKKSTKKSRTDSHSVVTFYTTFELWQLAMNHKWHSQSNASTSWRKSGQVSESTLMTCGETTVVNCTNPAFQPQLIPSSLRLIHLIHLISSLNSPPQLPP